MAAPLELTKITIFRIVCFIMKDLIIGLTVGYMLKVLKSGRDISQFKKEFDAIRHGDYIKFIQLVNGPIPYMAIYDHGKIISGTLPPSTNDIDFALLLKAGPSLKIFLQNCFSVYGKIQDNEITDTVYKNLALFEVSLRIHAKNDNLIKSEDKLEYVINILGKAKQIPIDDINKIHLGRKFLNMVKHNNRQFNSWNDGLSAFEESIKIIEQYNLSW